MGKVSETFINDNFGMDVRNANVIAENGNGEKQKKEEEEEEPEDPGSWKEAFFKACEECSFQGIAHVVGNTPFPIRRVLWFLLVIGAAVQITYQVADRVAYYLDYPSNVNVEVNYNNTLLFPSIAICNQNDFRRTRAFEEGIYDLVDNMFMHKKEFLQNENYAEARNTTTIRNLHEKLHHDVRDIIYSCQYRGQKCSPLDFSVTFTDFGVCFIFNGEPGDMKVNDVGSDVGLKLGINLEQYEYMSGSSGSAGVKVLIFEKDETPFVKDLGVTIPPGSHALVGIELLELKNLPKPHGDCVKDWMYDSYNLTTYTRSKCKRDKITKHLKDECKCRDHYMPPLNDTEVFPYCSLSQFLVCEKNAEEKRLNATKEPCRDKPLKVRALNVNCDCPVPCIDLVYNPSISYSALSRQMLHTLLTDKEHIVQIKTDYNYAQEVSQRVSASIREKDQMVFTRLLEATENMRNLLFYKFPEALTKASDLLLSFNETVQDAKQKNDQAFAIIHHLARWKFYRLFEVAKERYYDPFIGAFYGARESLSRALVQLNSTDDRGLIQTIKYRINDIVDNYEYYLHETNRSMTQIFESYRDTKMVWLRDNASPEASQCLKNFEKSDPRKNDCYVVDEVSVPKGYILDQPDWNTNVDKFYKHIEAFQVKFIDAVRGYVDQVDRGEPISEEAVDKTLRSFIYYSKRLAYNKAAFDEKHFHRPVELIEADWNVEFKNLYDRLYFKLKDLIMEVHGMKSYLDTIQSGSWAQMETIAKAAELYLTDKSSKKIDVASMAVNEKTDEFIKHIKIFLMEIRSRASLLKDKLSPLGQTLEEFWQQILGNEDLKPYHHFKNHTETLEEKQSEVAAMMKALQSDVSVEVIIGTSDEEFREAFAVFREGLDHFKAQSEIDEQFVKDNFLFIDFFFRELSYQRIKQQPAYDFFALLSDIGGAMGLLVGATFVTLLECCDVFIHHYFLKKRYTRGGLTAS